ncbi:MAG TPA: DUF397 domain-containing protein [Actinophytocola sp.]|uniref:DUF397 domain-containing protein n=1 Tax=Actinophytocola sp. TaxID=1872138 RepID=UPI002DDCDCB6|nr:DUF397 domain-containing protein [Actinophytocola sp.]HEV2780444.1 DUF397 domain-containing protein [Actinophytocola sp.]
MTSPEPRDRRWYKSSFSGGSGDGNCVEIAPTAGAVSIRDSKNTSGGELTLPAAAWHSFLLTLPQ